MTTLYRPVLIESAEQAEALPGNAVIIEKGPRHIDQAFLRHHALAFAEPYPGEGGAIALVPIEAEEETHGYIKYGRFGGEDSAGTRTRLVTPWEEA